LPLLRYRYYIEHIGQLLGADFKIRTNYNNVEYDDSGRPSTPDMLVDSNNEDHHLYYVAYAIFIPALVYVALGAWYLSNKLRVLADQRLAEKQERLNKLLESYKLDEN
jgi:hypothetical protein